MARGSSLVAGRWQGGAAQWLVGGKGGAAQRLVGGKGEQLGGW